VRRGIAKVCQRVVDPQADAELRPLPAIHDGDHEGNGFDEVWREPVEQSPFHRCLAHEAEVALFEVTESSVHELR